MKVTATLRLVPQPGRYYIAPDIPGQREERMQLVEGVFSVDGGPGEHRVVRIDLTAARQFWGLT